MPNLIDQGTKLSFQLVKARQVLRKCVFRSDRFADAIWENRSMIDAPANPKEMPSRLPEVFRQEGFVLSPHIEGGDDPEVLHLRGCCRSDAVKPLYRECLNKIQPHRGRDDKQAIRLTIVGGQLGQKL